MKTLRKIPISDNETRDCKPSKSTVIINTHNPLVHIIILGGWALIRGWVPLKFQGGVVGVGAYSRLGTH